METSIRLPREAYTNQMWHDEERKELFRDSWVFVGTEGEFKSVGDVRPVLAGAFPLFVVRSKEGGLAAFQNFCRHRGTQLIEEIGNVGSAIVCPYHRWSYGLDGRMRGAPDMAACFPDLNKDEVRLKAAAVSSFKGFVFANPNPHAIFDDWIAEIRGAEWPHDLSARDLREGVPLTYDMKCDWKVFVENALDGYHLAYLHESTLGGPLPSENIWERKGDHMVWYAVDDGSARHRLPALVRKQTKRLPKVKSASEPGYGGVYYLFPTTLIVPTPFGLSVSSLKPTGPGR